jgi:4'-phosphopantetheinyl transferase EntD
LIYLSLNSFTSPKNESRSDTSFLAGRIAASSALKKISIHSHVGKNEEGLPVWPEGICGSISHTEEQAVAVVGLKTEYLNLGVDIEVDYLKAQKVFHRTGTLQEQQTYQTLQQAAQSEQTNQLPHELFPLFIFSAKESFYKAFNSLIAFPLRFNDISLSVPESGFEQNISFDETLIPHFRGTAKLVASERLAPFLQGIFITLDIMQISPHTIITIISAKNSKL